MVKTVSISEHFEHFLNDLKESCQGRSKSRPLGRSKREPVEDREGVFRGRRGAGA
jgi:hypothetical protein